MSRPAIAQIDPVDRKLLQVGYNAAFEGHAPIALYAFYYYNKPDFLEHTNLTLRLAIAPTYLDSELGFKGLLGENTDLGIGIAGGGYADSYWEIDHGRYDPKQSFDGHGGEGSISIYHLFNPGAKIPLNGVFRVIGHYSVYDKNSDTAKDFDLPDDRGTFKVRTGLRFGGKEPTLFPSLAMELSVWYQGEFRTSADHYGTNNELKVERDSHLFLGEAMLIYTLPKLQHNFSLGFTAGTSIDADRFSAYRLGAFLPLVAEYPLSIPGYYYQELSAKEFILFSASYMIPLDEKQRWNINLNAATADVGYIEGTGNPRESNTGVGAGLLYKTPSFKIMLTYGYGVDAIRSHGRGAHSIGVLMQLDWSKARAELFSPSEPNLWQGMQRIFGMFGQ